MEYKAKIRFLNPDKVSFRFLKRFKDFKQPEYKEWTDHKNGYRYYVNIYEDAVKITIVTYPNRNKVFETTMSKMEYNAFIDYIKI